MIASHLVTQELFSPLDSAVYVCLAFGTHSIYDLFCLESTKTPKS